MLSRVAVSLYVLGGRLERIEQVARVLRVHADEARDFMRLGKFTERGAATARLVTRKAEELQGAGDDAIEWGAALRCCSSFEAYRLRFVGPVGPHGVIGFLLSDRACPRSVSFC